MILAWIGLSFLVGIIAVGRKVGFIGGLLLSLVFSPLIGLIIVLAFGKSEEPKAESSAR